MTLLAASGSSEAADIRIGRQGIFDVAGRLVGHELLFRGVSELSAGLSIPLPGQGSSHREARFPDEHDRATSQVIAATFGDFGVEMLGGGKPLFINLTRPFLVGDYPLPFGPEGVVLEVLENVVVDEELLEALRDLRERGFKLAADDFIGEVDRWALVPFVDVVKVDALALRTPLKPLVATIRDLHPTVELLAERIEQSSELPAFHDAGFTLFQGYAFARPAVIMQTRMSPTQLVCVRLLKALADSESSVADLQRILAADPGLSLRVLRTANSTQSGLLRKVSSLHQAVVLLGPVVLSAWIVLTLMGGLGSGRRSDLVSVLSRAVACEQLAIERGQDQSQAYTAGLLSGIAAVLGNSPREVALAAGLDAQMVSAIENGTGAIGELLRAVECHERDDDAGLALTHVSPFDVSRAYLTGLSSALSTVDGVLGQDI